MSYLRHHYPYRAEAIVLLAKELKYIWPQATAPFPILVHQVKAIINKHVHPSRHRICMHTTERTDLLIMLRDELIDMRPWVTSYNELLNIKENTSLIDAIKKEIRKCQKLI